VKLYIAGPMSGIEDHNFPAFNRAADRLKEAGYEVENPADHGADGYFTWADYMKLDIPLMLKCDGVALLDGWTHSKGACLEVYIADALEMPRRYVDDWLVEATK